MENEWKGKEIMERTIELYALYVTDTRRNQYGEGIILTEDGKIPDDKWNELKEKIEWVVKRTDEKWK